MVDTEIILAKATAVEKHLRRIREKSAVSLDVFKDDNDLQDIMLFTFFFLKKMKIKKRKDNGFLRSPSIPLPNSFCIH